MSVLAQVLCSVCVQALPSSGQWAGHAGKLPCAETWARICSKPLPHSWVLTHWMSCHSPLWMQPGYLALCLALKTVRLSGNTDIRFFSAGIRLRFLLWTDLARSGSCRSHLISQTQWSARGESHLYQHGDLVGAGVLNTVSSCLLSVHRCRHLRSRYCAPGITGGQYCHWSVSDSPGHHLFFHSEFQGEHWNQRYCRKVCCISVGMLFFVIHSPRAADYRRLYKSKLFAACLLCKMLSVSRDLRIIMHLCNLAISSKLQDQRKLHGCYAMSAGITKIE